MPQISLAVVIAMEYVPGGVLFDQIKRMGHYSELTATKIIKEVISATAYLHSKNIGMQPGDNTSSSRLEARQHLVDINRSC